MAEVTAGYMGEIRKREARDTEISKLKKREAARAVDQGTVRDPSAKGGKPSFYQETNEDEEAARSRERHMAHLKESQSRRREMRDLGAHNSFRQGMMQEGMQKQKRISNE
jgi:hypothetical protein